MTRGAPAHLIVCLHSSSLTHPHCIHPLPAPLQFLVRGCVECARTVISQLLAAFASSQTLWIKAVQLEKQHGTRATLDAILAQAVQACPQSDTLWLMGAKEKWLAVRRVVRFCFASPDCDFSGSGSCHTVLFIKGPIVCVPRFL
jgi:hypothetical protein